MKLSDIVKLPKQSNLLNEVLKIVYDHPIEKDWSFIESQDKSIVGNVNGNIISSFEHDQYTYYIVNDRDALVLVSASENTASKLVACL